MVLVASSSAWAKRVTVPGKVRPGNSSTVSFTGTPLVMKGTSASGTNTWTRTRL